MDRRERQRLEDDINHGRLNTGIHMVEEGAYEKESRLPLVKGGTAGLAVGTSAAAAYGNHVGFSSPLGLFVDDYVLVMLGIIVGGTAIGALAMWTLSRRSRSKEG